MPLLRVACTLAIVPAVCSQTTAIRDAKSTSFTFRRVQPGLGTSASRQCVAPGAVVNANEDRRSATCQRTDAWYFSCLHAQKRSRGKQKQRAAERANRASRQHVSRGAVADGVKTESIPFVEERPRDALSCLHAHIRSRGKACFVRTWKKIVQAGQRLAKSELRKATASDGVIQRKQRPAAPLTFQSELEDTRKLCVGMRVGCAWGHAAYQRHIFQALTTKSSRRVSATR